MLCSSISLYKTKVYTFDFCGCSSLCMWFFCLLVFWKECTVVPCLIHGHQVFSLLPSSKYFVGSGVFLYLLFIFLIVGTSSEAVSPSELCISEWYLNFSGYKLLGGRICATWRHHLGGWLGWYLCLCAPPPSPRLSHSQRRHIKVWENEDPTMIH